MDPTRLRLKMHLNFENFAKKNVEIIMHRI
jgi:hypothetical protein